MDKSIVCGFLAHPVCGATRQTGTNSDR